ncbi:MAG TPA: tetratricopeptide repeat protein [bacterium]|nr:tetratricopeptide repeat protein [bacterium]
MHPPFPYIVKIKSWVCLILVFYLSAAAIPQNIADNDDPFTCAVIAFNESLYEISIEFLDQYFSNPESKKNDYALFLYGINLLKLKKYGESLTKFEQFTKNFPDSPYMKDAWKYTITLQMLLNRSSEAWKTYSQGIANYGRQIDIEKNLGYMLLDEVARLIQSNNDASAKNILQQMEQVLPETGIVSEIQYYQALIYYKENNFEKALQKFLSALPYFKNHRIEPEILLKIGDCFFNLKNYSESQKYYDQIISKFSKSLQAEWAKFHSALIYKKNMKYKEAKKILTALVKATTNDEILIRSCWELGKISMLEDKKDDAVMWYNKIIVTAKDQEIIMTTKLELGHLYFNQGDYSKAITLFSEYLNFKNDEDVIYALGSAFYNNNQTEQAVEIWESLMKQNPGYPFSLSVLKILYNFYKEKNNRDMMKYIFNKIWEKYPEDNFILTEGIIFLNEILNTGATEEAARYLKKLDFQKNSETLFLNAKVLYLTGNYQQSEQMLKQIDKKSVFAAEALYLLIEINLAKSNVKDAQMYYVKLLASFPKSIWAQKARDSISKYNQLSK